MREARPGVVEEDVGLVTEDDHSLRGTWYSPASGVAPDRAVLLNSGAGIACRHYRHLARFLAGAGIAVLTYDYRGVGVSSPPSLANFDATIEDWSEFDCTAATRWLATRCPRARLTGIGHSFGSLLFGGSRAASLVADYVMIGPHTGYPGDYRMVYRIPMAVVWHLAMPAITRMFGYFPASRLRLGDDLPKGVALQWGHQRRTPAEHLQAGDRLGRLIGDCARVTGRALLIVFSDDGFGTAAGAARVRDYFPGLAFEQWLIRPADVGLARIGHFGFFKQTAADRLWPRLLAHLGGPSTTDGGHVPAVGSVAARPGMA
ncbi:MAG: alpha/beta fold hydrolase [Burkholderiales bacterium]